MVRGVPWDDLYERKTERLREEEPGPSLAFGGEVEGEAVRERDLQKDGVSIGKNFAQGFAVGGISGSVFGLADVMMDIKAMSAGKTNYAPTKVFRFGTTLGLFLSSYYGVKRTLDLYNPYVPTTVDRQGLNDITAALISFVPLTVYGPARRYIPYAALLLGFDYFSSNK